MRMIALLILVLSLTSCTTLVNKAYTEVNLYSKQDSVKVYFRDTAVYIPVRLEVARSRQPLSLILEKDSIRHAISIPSRLAPEYWYGNLLNGALYMGYLIDLSNEKRFKYPNRVLYDVDTPDAIDFKFKPVEAPINFLSQKQLIPRRKDFAGQRGTINIKLSVPEGNSLVLNQETHIGHAFGFLGITSQVDYYYQDKAYFGAGVGTVTDFIIPVPAPYDVYGEYERSVGAYVDVLHGFDTQRFSFNYGLSLSKYVYAKRITEELFPNYVDSLLYAKREDRLGLSASAKYRITHYFNCGIKYLPSLYTLKSNEFRYGHLLFLDIAFNFEIKKKQRKSSTAMNLFSAPDVSTMKQSNR